jgi:hypothetical protein
MRKWSKLGLLYGPNSQTHKHSKLVSHFSNPVPIHLTKDVFRVFYSGRDEMNRSSIGAVEIDIIQRTVLQEFHEPILEFGPKGSFYSDGISLGNHFQYEEKNFISFMGWQNPKNSHWRGDLGKIRINNDLTLTIDDISPILKNEDPTYLSFSYPWIMEKENNGYIMFYGSTIKWDNGNGEMLHVIISSESKNCRDWKFLGHTLSSNTSNLQAVSRPSVVKRGNEKYEMWFSYRGAEVKKYRIGYASSFDCKTWKLELERAGITVSENGWDDEMIEYPYVFEHSGELFMLYNGNDFGRTGFGLAVLDEG